MASVELASPRQQAFCLLRYRTLEQRANLMVGPTILGRRGPWKPMEQGRHSSGVLAHPSEVWVGFIVRDDPLVHITGHGACAPTVSTVLDLTIKLNVFLLKLESRFLELLVSGLQLPHP